MNRKIFFCLTTLAAVTSLGIYTSTSSPDPEYTDNWTDYQIRLTGRLGQEPFSFDKRLQRGLENTQEKAKDRWQKIKDYISPKKAGFDLIITESRVPPFVAIRGWLAEEDAKKIIKEYGEAPFEFSTDDKINTHDCIRQLEQAGYHPQRGVYDLSSPESDLEGFTVPLKHSPAGYAILTEQGKISRIRELRNYAQYLNAKEQKKEYTAIGNVSCFLPNITEKTSQSGTPAGKTSPPAVNKDWSEKLISYVYIARDEPDSHATPEIRRQAICQKVYFKDYDYMYEHIYQHYYLAVSDEDRKEIIRKYGKHPLCLSCSLRKRDQAALMRRLKEAGYAPIVTKSYSGDDGFSFPLKDSPGGYLIIFDRYTYITKLFNYNQYLRNKDSRDYTAEHNIDRLYLPDLKEENNNGR